MPPVDLGALAREKVKREERLGNGRAELADQTPDQGDATGVTSLAQTLEYLLCGVGMLVKEANDFGTEGIELGGATGWFSHFVARAIEPDAHGFGMEVELAGDLGHRETIASAKLVNELVGVEVDHAAPPVEPSAARRMSPTERSSPQRGEGAGVGESRPRTW